MEERTEEQKRRYVAFISYRHVSPDREIARRIHTRIEHFRIPEEYRKAYGSDKLGLAFRDEEELPASSNLSDNIREALDNSAFLIVVCTTNTPESVWVEREITYFMEHHDRDHVLAVLVEGRPEASFPKPLLQKINEQGEVEEVEPLAANLTEGGTHLKGGRFSREITRIFAAILGCPFDGLWQRERRYRTRRLATILGVGLAAALVFLGVVVVQNRQIREQNRQISEQSRQIEADSQAISQQNAEIREKNDQILAQVEELKERENVILTNQGNLLLEKGDRRGAVESALEALDTTGGDRPYYPEAERLMLKALGAYRGGNDDFEPALLITQDQSVVTCVMSTDGTLLATMDETSVVSLYEAEKGELLWEYQTPGIDNGSYRERILEHADTEGCNLQIDEKNRAVIVTLPGKVQALSVETGEELWTVTGTDTSVRTMSPDGTKMMIMSFTEDGLPELRLIDLADGKTLQSLEVEPPNEQFREKTRVLTEYAVDNPKLGVFSADGKSYAFAVQYVLSKDADQESSVLVDWNRGGLVLYYRWDLETDEVSLLGTDDAYGSASYSNEIFGMVLNDEGDLVVYWYDSYDHTVNSSHQDGTGDAGHSGGQTQLLRSFWDEDTQVENRYCFLPGKTYTLLAVNNMLYIYHTKTGSYRGSHNEGQDIEALYWRDPEQLLFDMITESGNRPTNKIDAEEEYLFSISAYGYLLSMGEIRILASTPSIFAEEENFREADDPLPGAAVAIVRRSHPDEVVVFRPLGDPHGDKIQYDPKEAGDAWNEKRQAQAEQVRAAAEAGEPLEALLDWDDERIQSKGIFLWEDEKEDPYLFPVLEFTIGARIRTEDGRYEVLSDELANRVTVTDLDTGDVVFEKTDYMSSLRVWNDTGHQRLYIGSGSSMICLDTDSYTELFDLYDIVDFLPEENRLIAHHHTGDEYYSYPAYTVEELVEWGKQWLAGETGAGRYEKGGDR
ncbi:MAG: TIR domain-containing protein [Lachnospiraceae bacterium]|nr:TIR domain-containing protein [Lachnospiraceae bacterium]